MSIEIKEAQNGWIVSSRDSKQEPKVFEFDGGTRWRNNLENIVMTAERVLNQVLSEMVGSEHYKIKVMEDVEDVKPSDIVVGPVPTEAFTG